MGNTKKKSFIALLVVTPVLILMLIVIAYHFATKPTSKQVQESRDQVKADIYENLASYKTEFTISVPAMAGMNWDDASAYYVEVVDEHPELFWLTSGLSYDVVNSDSKAMEIKIVPEFNCDSENVADMDVALQSMVRFIAESAKEAGSSETEQAKFVHDELIKMCNYVEDSDDPENVEDPLLPTAYGCIFNAQASGEGYAKAYCMILEELGIECGYIAGVTTIDGTEVGHGWNYVKLNDEYVFVDVSMDDVLTGESEAIDHQYFGINEETMNKNHNPADGQDIPTNDTEEQAEK